MPPKEAPKSGSARAELFTVQQIECWKQRLKTEHEAQSLQLKQDLKRAADAGKPVDKVDNNYYGYYRKEGTERRPHIKYTFDKIRDTEGFDAKAKYDTMYPQHTRHQEGLQTCRPLRTSQQYGWYAPIDQPKYGFERTRICQDSFMDKSHMQVGDSTSQAADP